ncbi:hypothetical protein [Legionella brunensis]|uniref:F-box domain-containing protein n=1 Tax=Legionella brunensis TaxID=29422 RepID=A0A0W0S5S8_9GAMM|nr:hypothetical protein [Legionella brunensis]KTC78413.1 hypothetical protein Lbru_2705 [Legionella brunensis]
MHKSINFSFLPDDSLKEIGQQLKKKDQTLSNLVLVNKKFYQLFQSARLLEKLLEHVAKGNQVKAEWIIKKHPELLLLKGKVTDYSGREFENISAFQLALWALDVKYMAPMMLKCLPKNETGKKIKNELLRQFEELKTKGIRYTLNGVIFNESHFSLSPLLTVLQTYVTNFYNLEKKQRQSYWCTVVGKAQWFVPAHIAQHYCDQEDNFCSTPKFDKDHFERNLTYYDALTNEPHFWFSPANESTGLGVNVGVVHGGALPGEAGYVAWGCLGGLDQAAAMAPIDLAALSTLYEVRMNRDLVHLEQELVSPHQITEIKPQHHNCVLI